MPRPYFTADQATVTVLKPVASSAFGSYKLSVPEDVDINDVHEFAAPGNELGYVASLAPAGQRVGGFARRFVRADVSVTAADTTDPDWVPSSDVDKVLTEAAARVEGDFFLESDITKAGLGPWVPFTHFEQGDLATVEIWGRRVPLPVTRIEPKVTDHDENDWAVHVGGQVLTDDEARLAENETLRQAAVQSRREVAGLESQTAKAVSTAESAVSTADSVAADVASIAAKINSLPSADGKSTNFYGAEDPLAGGANPNPGDTWFRDNTDGSITILVFDGAKGWVEAVPKVDFSEVNDRLDQARADVEQAKQDVAAAMEDVAAVESLVAKKVDTSNFDSAMAENRRRLQSLDGDLANKISRGDVQAPDIVANAVTADKIQAGAVVAGKIAAGAVTAGTIAADAVTAREIKAGSLTSDNVTIKNGAITDAMIQNGSITAASIKDATITSAKIAQLDAGKITTGYLNAARIAAGSISTEKLAANSITTEKLAIVPGNLFPDPHFRDPSWEKAGQTTRSGNNNGELNIFATGKQNGTYYQPAGVPADTAITVEPGSAYRVSSTIDTTTGTNQVDVYMRYRKKDSGVGATWLGAFRNLPNGVGTYSINVQTPGDMRDGSCTIGFYLQASQTSGKAALWNTQLTRAADSSLIVEGAIKAEHIAADTITARQVNADEIFLKADGDQSLKAQYDDLRLGMTYVQSAVSYIADRLESKTARRSGIGAIGSKYEILGSRETQSLFSASSGHLIATGAWKGRVAIINSHVDSEYGKVPFFYEIDAATRSVIAPTDRNYDPVFMYEIDPVTPTAYTLRPSSNWDAPKSTWVTVPGMSVTLPTGTESYNITGQVTFTNVNRGSTYGVRVLVNGSVVSNWSSTSFGPLGPWGDPTWSSNVTVAGDARGGQKLEVQVYCSDGSASKRRVTTASSIKATAYVTG
ncbi:hypothetical protein VVR46_00455 [Corynebacterium phoceense]|uniref:hypothetical protein n=1 Tax=Corynebacterium phoceense TaxID=1686286 RepID=UPI0034CFEDF5